LAAHDFLLISHAVAPFDDGAAAIGAHGVGRALAALGHRATVLTLAAPEAASAQPGLARRLRTVSAPVGAETRELPIYEGRSAGSETQLLVVGATPRDRGEAAALLAGAVRSLAADGLIGADVAIAWGETAAPALSVSPASARLFVLPTGRTGAPLSADESRSLGASLLGDDATARSLVAIGCLAASAIVSPSPSAARECEADPGLASRASDEPFVAVRFGCNDPPNDPATDPALPLGFSAAALAGKAECRRAISRRCSLAVGPRTLVLTTGPLSAPGDATVAAIAALAPFDVATIIVPRGDSEAVDRARRLALEQPGRVAVFPADDAASERLVRAGADAILLHDNHDRIGRSAGLALLYGTLPIAADVAANHDYLVDYDPGSRTGNAILYEPTAGPFELESAIRRALALRADADVWSPFVKGLIDGAPRWSTTAAALVEIIEETLNAPA
jgi:hypothetical protein